MDTFMKALLWVFMGGLAALFHLLLLRYALAHAVNADPVDAGKQIMMGMPLRLLVISPVMLLAARAGLVACGGLVLGFLFGRGLILTRRRRFCDFALTNRKGWRRGH